MFENKEQSMYLYSKELNIDAVEVENLLVSCILDRWVIFENIFNIF